MRPSATATSSPIAPTRARRRDGLTLGGGPDSAGARRLGHDRRLVVGRQPDHRLPRDRSRRWTPNASPSSATRVSARPCCGRRRKTSASPPSSRAARERWAPRSRAATGARRSTTWRRTSRGSSRGASAVGRPLERHAGRRAHADRAQRAAPRVHHRRHGGSVGRPGRHVQGGGCRGPVYRLLGRRISAPRSCRRSIRRSPAATSAGTITPAVTRRRRRTGRRSSRSSENILAKRPIVLIP